MIIVKNLTKKLKVTYKQNLLKDILFPKFKTITAVNNISFKIEDGESVAFLGPNGAGKTTTIKMLTGLIYPTNGYIKVANYIPQKRQKSFLKSIGLVLGNKGGLNWDLTPLQTFTLIRDIYDIKPTKFKKRLKDLTEQLNVSHVLNTQVRKLSLGERMKLEIISTLLYEPKVLFLDEPTIGLDIMSVETIHNLLAQVNKKQGVTIFLTSHNMEDIEKLSQRVIIINKGRIIYDGKLKTLKQKFGQEQNIKFVLNKNTNINEIKKLKIHDFNLKQNILTIKTTRQETSYIIAKIIKHLQVKELEIQNITLNQIIIKLFKQL